MNDVGCNNGIQWCIIHQKWSFTPCTIKVVICVVNVLGYMWSCPNNNNSWGISDTQCLWHPNLVPLKQPCFYSIHSLKGRQFNTLNFLFSIFSFSFIETLLSAGTATSKNLSRLRLLVYYYEVSSLIASERVSL